MGRKSKEQKATEQELTRFEKNYASNKSVADRFMEHLGSSIEDAMNNRLELDNQWINDYRQWSCVLDDGGYQGRSNIFVPEMNNQVEQSTEKSLATMFPQTDFIHTIPMAGTDEKQAEKIKKAVSYEIEEKVQLFLKHEEFERNKRVFGTAIYKAGFKKEMLDVFSRDQKTNKPIKEQVPIYHGVTWDVVDIFKWYKWPEMGPLNDYHVIFEKDLRPIDEIEDDDSLVNNKDIQPMDQDTRIKWVELEKYEIVNLSTAIKRRPNHCLVTEVNTHFALDGKNKVPVRAKIVNNTTLVELIRNPFWFQKAPYLADVYKQRPGKMFYGFSMFDKSRTQGYQMNDLTNHTMDSLTFSLNPIAKIDPALAGDINSFKVMPGAKWLGAPDGIKFEVFPDVSGSGLRAMQEIRGQIAQFSDNAPGIAPQLEGKARSATQAAIINNNVSQRQRIEAMGEEHRIFKPMFEMTHVLLEQFMEDEWTIKYQGPDAGEWVVEAVSPGDIVGKVNWIWRGALQQEKTAVRSQQLISFFQMAMQVAQMMPQAVDLPALYKRVAKEGFDLRDMDQYFPELMREKTVDPIAENEAFLSGSKPEINPGDDDDAHIDAHLDLAEDKSVDKEIRLSVLEHIRNHKSQKDAKQKVREFENQMKARQQLQQVQQMGGQEQGNQKDGREGVAVPSPMEGNRGQNATTPDAIMSGVKGVE